MPTYADQVSAARGIFRARLAIEGWPNIFVDDASLLATESDGRVRIEGLDPLTLRLGASADLVSADLDQTEMSVEFINDGSDVLSQSLLKRPTKKTWLTEDLTVAATTVTVASTSGWASSGYIHVHNECIRYTSLGGGGLTFEGCTRGYWDTTAQYHYTADGVDLSMPAVTDLPTTVSGRRVTVSLYGSADSAAGNGTPRWRGICRSAPEFQEGRITIAIEPMAWLLEQALGGDTDEPSPIRGIYLSAATPLSLRLVRGSSGSKGSSTSSTAEVTLSGFWETQEEFIAALQTEIDTAVSGFGWDADTEFAVESVGPNGWRFNYRVGSTNAYWLQITSGHPLGRTGAEGYISPVDIMVGGVEPSWRKVGDAIVTGVVTAGDVYEIDVVAPVPRGTLGPPLVGAAGTVSDFARPENIFTRIYLGGTTVPQRGTIVVIDNGGEEDGERPIFSDIVDATERTLDLDRPPQLAMGPHTRVKVVRPIKVSGGLGDLIDALVTSSPTLVNAGAMPLVTTNDFDTDWSEVEAAEASSALALRTWLASEAVTLRSVITHELRLRGCYMAIDGTGKIRFKRLRPPLITDAAAATVDVDSTIGGFSALSISPYGFINRIKLRQKWDYIEEEHRGPTIKIRNVEISDSSPSAGVLEVAPRSTSVQRSLPMEYTVEFAYLMAASRLGMFGGAYRVVTIEVSMVHFLVELGSVIAVSTEFLPASDGTMGLDTVGILIGYDWTPTQGEGQFTILLLDLNIGGYSPGLLVDAATDTGEGGFAWDLTVDLAPHTAETNVSTWFAVGDEIRLMERDTESPTIVTGAVTAITDPTTVTVSVLPSWGGVSASGDHILTYDTTANVDETAPSGRRWAQTDFATIAGSDRRVALASGDVDAVEFSP